MNWLHIENDCFASVKLDEKPSVSVEAIVRICCLPLNIQKIVNLVPLKYEDLPFKNVRMFLQFITLTSTCCINIMDTKGL